MIGIFYRYLILEMVKPFFVGLLGFIVFMISEMMFVLVDHVVSRGVDLISVAKIIVYRIPAFSVIAIPVAILFAVINSVTKLESNFEITSMRILGFRFYYIVVPFVIVSVFMTFLNFFLNENIVPLTMKISEDIIKEKIIKGSISFIQSDVFFKMPDGKIVIVRNVDKMNKVLHNVVISDVRVGNFSRIITSKRGYIQGLSIVLEDGFLVDLSRDGFVKSQVKFEKLIIPFNLSFDDIIKELRNPWEMSYNELKQELDNRERFGWRDNFLKTQLYLKFSLPLSCVVVVILSLPLAVMFANRGKFMGLLISVFLIFVYYSLFSFFVALGKNNLLNPF
ncbi:MAG: LptF/LptG family permease, partial [Candidatus Calescibacterium sp.]|nr:LptF/LptG family permease [Candidatus Calescibacterium sp.]